MLQIASSHKTCTSSCLCALAQAAMQAGEMDDSLVLASIVGTATETLIRLLSEFRREGLIKIEDGKIYIQNLPQLMREADLYAAGRS